MNLPKFSNHARPEIISSGLRQLSSQAIPDCTAPFYLFRLTVLNEKQ